MAGINLPRNYHKNSSKCRYRVQVNYTIHGSYGCISCYNVYVFFWNKMIFHGILSGAGMMIIPSYRCRCLNTLQHSGTVVTTYSWAQTKKTQTGIIGNDRDDPTFNHLYPFYILYLLFMWFFPWKPRAVQGWSGMHVAISLWQSPSRNTCNTACR